MSSYLQCGYGDVLKNFRNLSIEGLSERWYLGREGGGLPDSCELECWKDEVLGLKEEACSSSEFLP